jgi:hypothetical protein
MGTIIDYNEAAGFLKNPFLLEPHPDFATICALQKHVIKALFQLFCPQSTIHGWSGLAINLPPFFCWKAPCLLYP